MPMPDVGGTTVDHDERLMVAVRPPDWSNPTPRHRYNLVVLGGGTAGLVAAAACAGLGGRVALVEKSALGGDCLNTGCVPSKALIAAARAAHDARMAPAYGIHVGPEVRVDFKAVMERVRAVRADLAAHDSAARFRDLGVDVFFGHGRFIDRSSIEVDGATLRFAKALIATGSSPRIPPIPGLREAGYLTSDTVFETRTLPPRLAIVGGGAIGCELAQAFARLGSAVTLFEIQPNLLETADPDAADLIARALRRDGVRTLIGAAIDRVNVTADGARQLTWSRIVPGGRTGDRRSAGTGDAMGGPKIDADFDETGGAIGDTNDRALGDTMGGTVEVDAILVAAGRQPNIDGLGLKLAGVQTVDGALVVGDDLRTTNRRIFAAGDVATEARFTHAADAMARIVVRNALFLGRRRYDPGMIPSCVFTDPEVAHVGLRAGDAGVRTSHRVALDTVDRVRTDDVRGVGEGCPDGADAGFAAVYVGRGDRIVGTTVVGSGAGETIGAFALAMAGGLGLSDLSEIVLPYPTRGLVVRALGDAHQRARLTPAAARASRLWLEWTRRA